MWRKEPCFHNSEEIENIRNGVYRVLISDEYSARAAALYFYSCLNGGTSNNMLALKVGREI